MADSETFQVVGVFNDGTTFSLCERLRSSEEAQRVADAFGQVPNSLSVVVQPQRILRLLRERRSRSEP